MYIIISENSRKINGPLLVIYKFMSYNSNVKTLDLKYFSKGISVAIGIILIWRGVWIILDLLDKFLLGGNHVVTAVGGIIVGILMLYLPDKNLKALERL